MCDILKSFMKSTHKGITNVAGDLKMVIFALNLFETINGMRRCNVYDAPKGQFHLS